MILTSLSLSNFRSHRKLVIELKPGITGIIGPNGTGKSSIIEAILFVLTGRLFHDSTKTEAILLGEDTGFVTLCFTLNGKAGKLTRHLDISSTFLEYDNKTYKKAGEVKEMWDDLLQINSEIIERVIIAKQGRIQQLFSGDQSVREKVFQKIFLVPNTEKIRTSMLKNYIRTCPPIIPLEDMNELWQQKHKITKDIKEIGFQLDEVSRLSEVDLRRLEDRLKFVTNCINEQGKLITLHQAKEGVEVQLIEIEEEMVELSNQIRGYRLPELERAREQMLNIKNQTASRAKLHKSLDNLVARMTATEAQETEAQLDELEHEVHKLNMQVMEINMELGSVTKQLSHFSTLHGEANCQLCGQSLDSVQGLINTLTKDRNKLQAKLKELKQEHITGAQILDSVQKELEDYKNVMKQREQITDLLKSFSSTEFDEVKYNELQDTIAQLRQCQGEILKKQVVRANLESKIALYKEQISKVPTYDKESDPRQEAETLSAKIAHLVEDLRIKQQKTIALRIKEIELATINDKIKANEVSREKNARRNKYMDTLSKVYDAFHSSAFPRKLILDYAGTVSEYLNEKLSDFSIPYSAKVTENFKFIMHNRDGLALPAVSGGQEVLVGLGLHLALHDLFSQSFPLMIIDEGTTHLDEENVASYFDVIRQLKKETKNKQIIIIDHHPALSEVVDQTIELKKQ
jgi:DNA repair exonuclease SbcCD ATPase subunit